MNASIDSDFELEILFHINQSPANIRQRDLATIVGKSLGMTNAILHRLTEKGMLTVAKVNNRNISYAVTPYGMRQLAGRSYRYFKRTIKNVVDYKDAIEVELCRHLQVMAVNLSMDQPRTLVLLGKSDLEFILEHLAHKYNMGWKIVPGGQDLEGAVHGLGTIVVWSEDCEAGTLSANDTPVISLRTLAGIE